MNLLAFDTATSACSAAFWSNGRVLARRLTAMQRGHAEELIPMVAAVLAEAGCDFSGIDLLAVTVGPGTFNGVRIGLAAARGMALATGLPCVGVTTLEAVAEAVDAEERARGVLLVVLDIKRGDLFAQAFAADGAPLTAPAAVPAQRLADLVPAGAVILAGDAAPLALPALSRAGRRVALATTAVHPDAAAVATVAARRWNVNRDISPPAPLYLRAPAVTLPVAGGRRR
jgi:tRNA threonylcarbamoyladenosine biosynthesis protein TsaB